MNSRRLRWTVGLISLIVLGFAFFGLARATEDDFVEKSHRIRSDELELLEQQIGVYEEGKNYNVIIDGHGTGLRPPTEEEWREIAKRMRIVDGISLTNPDLAKLTSIDHSQDEWFPPIGNQDGEGSCVCWAVGYYVKSYQEAKEHGWNISFARWMGGYHGYPTPSYQDKITSPDFIYHQINNGVDNGSWYDDAINLISSIGACSWKEMPYDQDPPDSTSWPSESAWREAPLYRADSTGYRYMNLSSSISGLKNLLLAGHLGIISINAYYYDDFTTNDLWTLDNYNPSGTNHANTIVGFDDNYGPYTEAGDSNTYGAFKIANSWGVGGWEYVPDGFYYISYECMKQRVKKCMYYYDRIGYEPSLVAVFKIDHPKRVECNIEVGSGDPSSPLQAKNFTHWQSSYWNGGSWPFPSNPIILDITEFAGDMPCNFFLKVYDGISSTTGVIEHFLIEQYDDYSSGVPCWADTSDDPPIATVQDGTVYAEIPERVPPAQILDLTGESEGDSSITLTWIAPGDDGNQGTAFAYDIRYDTTEVGGDIQNWWDNVADTAVGEPVPQPAGSQETFEVLGLDSGKVYYFAIKSVDDVGNWSNISNIFADSALDYRPPATVTDLSAESETDTSITLTWTAPGDDEDKGIASKYDVRYSQTSVGADLQNWWNNVADTAVGEPAPQPAGSTEVFVVVGLEGGCWYYFALQAVDDAGNWSDISYMACTKVGVSDQKAEGSLPREFKLTQNYPNPFNPRTEIRYALPKDTYVTLEIYNLLGQKVTTLVDRYQTAGYKGVAWDASSFATGIYLCRIKAGEYTATHKMILIK